MEQIEEYFNNKEKFLEELYTKSKLQYRPDEKVIKELLLNCLEMYYGSIDRYIQREPQSQMIINELKEIISKYDR